ncbi:uncharacterized protein ACIB01_014073 [Guaruba guarouba]
MLVFCSGEKFYLFNSVLLSILKLSNWQGNHTEETDRIRAEWSSQEILYNSADLSRPAREQNWAVCICCVMFWSPPDERCYGGFEWLLPRISGCRALLRGLAVLFWGTLHGFWESSVGEIHWIEEWCFCFAQSPVKIFPAKNGP